MAWLDDYNLGYQRGRDDYLAGNTYASGIRDEAIAQGYGDGWDDEVFKVTGERPGLLS